MSSHINAAGWKSWRIDWIGDNGYCVTNDAESYWFETKEWAMLCRDHFNRLESIKQPLFTFTLSNNTDGLTRFNTTSIQLGNNQHSEWTCHLFGSNGDGISWRPNKGREPNWFWRKMQYLFFGNNWVKENEIL